MLVLLAIAMSQPVLASDPHDAAMSCARVAASHGTSDVALVGAAHISYFLLQAARARPANGSIFGALKQVQAELIADPKIPMEEARNLAAACDARFPSARRQGTVNLPAPQLDRTLTCVMQLSVMGGIAERISETTGDRTALTRYSSALRAYTQREDAALKAAGYVNETAATALLEKSVIAALEIGNPYAISEACIAAL
jgi:hypothetical protein